MRELPDTPLNDSTPQRRLELADILDLRAYERVRDDYRRRVIEYKRRRRISLGSILTIVFESLDTMRFQVQEMARAERISTDEGIQHELDVYNRLLPSPGELSATLFIELTSEDQLRNWLPRLVGIERSLAIRVSDAEGSESMVASVPEEEHAAALTRESITAAVHYVRFSFTPVQVELFAAGQASLVCLHPEYQARTELAPETQEELLGDLEGRESSLTPG